MKYRKLVALFHSGSLRSANSDNSRVGWSAPFLAAFLVLLGPAATVSSAQQNSYLNNIGIPAFTLSSPVENGFVNVANGNLHLEVPLEGPFPQRGGNSFRAVLMYDSAIWYRNLGAWGTNGGGWRLVTSADTGSADYTTSWVTCFSSFYQENVITEIDFTNFRL